MDSLKEQKSEFPLLANSAIKQMEYLQVEIGLSRPKLYDCINLTTKYLKSPPGTKGFLSLGDVDEAICDYASRFRDALTKVQDYISDNLLTKMEKNEDFEEYGKFNSGIEELSMKMAEIPSKIFEFQKQIIEVQDKPHLVDALMKKHKAEEKQNIDLIYRKSDMVRRYFYQLCKPEQTKTCRI
jgi:hypothetical protein